MSQVKKVVNLEQHCYRSASCLHKGVPVVDGDKYVYKVKSLKNCLSPAIDSFISAGQVETLIVAGFEVNISQSK